MTSRTSFVLALVADSVTNLVPFFLLLLAMICASVVWNSNRKKIVKNCFGHRKHLLKGNMQRTKLHVLDIGTVLTVYRVRYFSSRYSSTQKTWKLPARGSCQFHHCISNACTCTNQTSSVAIRKSPAMTAVSSTTEEKLFTKYICVTEDVLTAICCAVILEHILMPETPAGEFKMQPHLRNKNLQCC